MNRLRSIGSLVWLPILVGMLALALFADLAHAEPTRRPNAPVCPGPVIGAAGCHSRVITDRAGTPFATSGPTGYGPAELHGAYELPSVAPTPQTIAIVDAYDDPTIESDLATYSATYGLPACTTANGCFRKVNQSGQEGTYPKADGGWALEISLDVETAYAICQNCEILLVEANSNGFANLTAAVSQAASLGATEISNSYGGPEYGGELADTAYIHPGIAITASAGDSGYGAEYPASSPYVIAVGGTTLNLGPGNSYGSETVWSGSGSGCSAYEAAQAWQASEANWSLTGCGTKRAVADVAADANPNTGVSVYDTTKDQGQAGWFQVGGTSLSAPLIAAVYALAGGGSADYPAADPYGHQADSPASLHDVTGGSNGSCGESTMCRGATGYDGPTGVGTPKGVAAFAAGGVDTTPPQTTIESGPSGPTSDSTPTFTFSSSEPGSSFECRVDAPTFAPCGPPYTSAPLGDGAHVFEVRAKDGAGNADPSPASRSFAVDTQAPLVSLAEPADGSLGADPTPTLAGQAGTVPGDAATVSIRIYAGTGTGGTLLQIRGASADPTTGAYVAAAESIPTGAYTVQASQSDSAGNTGVSAAHTFALDATPPTSAATAPASANSTSIAISYTASDSGSGLGSVELRVKPPGAGSYSKAATDSSPSTSGSFPYTAASGDGTYSFYTRAKDLAGNYEAEPAGADATTIVNTAGEPAPTSEEEETSSPPGETPPSGGSSTEPTLVPPAIEPPATWFKLGRIAGTRRRDTKLLSVQVPAAGVLGLAGVRVRTVRRDVGPGPAAIAMRLRRRFGAYVGPASIAVTYTPDGGSPVTKRATVRFG
jgi:hypothetical protein